MSLNAFYYHLFQSNPYFGNSTIFVYFSMALGVSILLPPQEEEVRWGHRYMHSAAQSWKRFKPLSGMTRLCRDY